MSSDFIESLKRLKKCDIEKLNIDSKVTCFSKPLMMADYWFILLTLANCSWKLIPAWLQGWPRQLPI